MKVNGGRGRDFRDGFLVLVGKICSLGASEWDM